MSGLPATGPGQTAAVLPTFDLGAHRLRPVRAEDATALHRHWNDPDVRRFLFDGCEVSVADAEALVAGSLADAERASYGLWVIDELSAGGIPGPDPAPVGTCALRVSSQPSVAPVEVVYSLAPTHWGRGLMRAAAGTVVAHALGPLGLPAVGAGIDEGNTASMAVVRRLGMARAPGGDEVGPLGRILWWRRAAGGVDGPGEAGP